jgi:hypothetical protein
MVTALSLMRGAPSSAPLDLDVRVGSLARWLAHQRAVPVHQVESTALEIASLPDPLEGPRAPVVVQPRGGLWLVGKLGGRALLHIFPDQEAAAQRGRELAEETNVSLLVVGQGGEVTRWRAQTAEGPTATVTALHPVPRPTAASPAAPAEPVAPPVDDKAAPLPLEVRHHASGWAVMLRGRVIATAPTREKARLRRKALLQDPDFTASLEPEAGSGPSTDAE